MQVCFQAERRAPMNSTGLKRLRKEGRLPGIVFGKNTENAMIHISTKEFQKWTRGGGTGVFKLDIEGIGTVPVLLEGVQRDTVTKDMIHVDFLQISKDQTVRTKIVIDYTGTAKGTKLNGIVQKQSTVIEIQALTEDLPSAITVDISDLDIGDSILAGDIALPSGVSLVSSVNELLVSVVAPIIETSNAQTEA